MPVKIDLLPPPVVLDRQDLHEERLYVAPDGKKLPSVTTILSATKPWHSIQALMRWKKKIGEEAAREITEKACRRGTLTHSSVENYLLTGEDTCHEDALPYWKSIKPVLNDITEVKLMESSVMHLEGGYAGTVDLLAVYKDILCVGDWKTADKPKGRVSNLYDYPLQLAAYIGAINKQYATHGISVRNAMLVVGIPNLEAEVFWFGPDEILKYWKQWVERLRQYHDKKKKRMK